MSNIKQFLIRAFLCGILLVSSSIAAISQISLTMKNRPVREVIKEIEKVSDYLQVGQEVTVKVVEIDRQGRIRLTMKDLAPKQETEAESAPAEDISEEQE